MNNTVLDLRPDQRIELSESRPVGQVPYITVHAFCETSALVSSVTRAFADRRLTRANVTISPGGIAAAIKCFGSQSTPDLLILEEPAAAGTLLTSLEAFAEVCDGKTKVIIVGASNDIGLYRRLVESGITEYLVGPVDPLSLIGTVLRLHQQAETAWLGKIFACMGTKGGTGSSTLAQNVAWSLAQMDRKVMLADMDFQFGTAALNYNIDAPSGFAEQLGEADHLDAGLLERLLYKRGPNLSVLTGATASQQVVEPALEVLDRMIDVARATFPFVVLDLPHSWTPFVRRALLSADEVVLTAAPDLANLRNAKGLMDLLKEGRPNDPKPGLVLNQIGMPKRAEIKPEKFAAALKVDLAASIGFDSILFSTAAHKGQMIGEASQKAAPSRAFDQLARGLAGQGAQTALKRPRLFWRR